MKKVAITGGLACGKSSVCRLFGKLGACVASADEIVHQLLSPSTNIGKQVIGLLGHEIVEDGFFDRRKIAQIIFHNRVLLQSLEKILHPAVFAQLQQQYRAAVERGDAHLFVAEIPLLFEAGYEGEFDYTIVVIAEPDLCRKRFTESTGCSDEDYFKRASLQWSLAEKAAKANAVIANNGSMIELEQQVKQLWDKLQN